MSATPVNPPKIVTKSQDSDDWTGFLKKTAVVAATGTLVGALGYGFYTTIHGHTLGNVRAMGFRVGAQFAIFAGGISWYAVTAYGSPSEIYERYQKTGKFLSDDQGANPQIQLQRHHHKDSDH